MIRYRAAWVVPIAGPPIRDGWVAVDAGRVVAVGGPDHPHADPEVAGDEQAREADLGRVAIVPGLVNAHTHLELSYLRGQVPEASSFVEWIRHVMSARRSRPDVRAPEILEAVAGAIDDAVACGTAVVGDISNTLVSYAALAERSLAAVVFYELIRFNPSDPVAFVEAAHRELEALPPSDAVRACLAAHAPYSVAPLVFRAIQQRFDHRPFTRCSVHLAESAEETEFVLTGGGPWRRVLEDLGSWDPAWVPPGVSPVRYLADSGFLDHRVLAVHSVQATPQDLELLAAHGTTIVACPRSNRHTGAGVPPIAAFYQSGVPVAVGTDSLASAPDLSVFAELAAMRQVAPLVPAARLLDSATRQGARALGFDDEYGAIEPGKRARLLAVDVPGGAIDVEEYLVSGIEPALVRWIE